MAAISIFEALRGAGIDRADARVLLRTAVQATDAHLAAYPEQILTAIQHERFRGWVERRRAGEPVAYIIGSREFYSLAFGVTPAVLIPRPETELLVETALGMIALEAPVRVLDLGTGSGCVAVAIGRYRARACVTAVDISRAALEVARENAMAHEVNIEFIESNWFAALRDRRFHLIVANPPYVADGDPHLRQGDLRFEPRGALVAGPIGLDAIEQVVGQASQHLDPGGWLLIEHGHDQAPSARALLAAGKYREVVTHRDLAGLERVSGGRVDVTAA